MRRFKSLFLLLLALWLPIQTAAAAAMPFCRHTTDPAAQTIQMAAVDEGHAAMPCHAQVDETAGKDAGCDNCGMCHLATAGYLLTSLRSLPPLAASILVPKVKSVSPSHIGDPPQQPPRRLN